MFTYVYLKNFKSFGEIRFDFKKNKTKPEAKRFAAIYGENGSGKSNFVSAFELLHLSLNSFRISEYSDSFSKRIKENNYSILIKEFQAFLQTIGFDYSVYRMIGCEEATTVEIGFLENGVEGYYRLVFKKEVVAEELYYLCGKKRGVLYSLDSETQHREISKKLFSANYRKEFENELDKYWGKHSLLAIMVKELDSKNRKYIDENISVNLLDAYVALNCCFVMSSNNNMNTVFGGFDIRKIPYAKDVPREMVLAQEETVLNALFRELYSDIREVYYEKTNPEDDTLPPLHVKKVIAGEVRDVLFDLESSGTKRILELSDVFLAVMNGNTVICDEIDTGIHDLLMKSILTALANSASGQLIITTHNTLLLESIESQSAYVIYVDSEGNKEARCFDDYEVRVQKTNNMRNLYLKGMYGGIPYASEIDFSFLINEDKSAGDSCG